MRVHSAILLVLLILMVTLGWLVGRASSPKALALLMGVAIGVVVTTPIHLLIATYIWSPRHRAMGDSDSHQQLGLPSKSTGFLGEKERAPSERMWPLIDERIHDRPPNKRVIRYLGE